MLDLARRLSPAFCWETDREVGVGASWLRRWNRTPKRWTANRASAEVIELEA